MKDKLTMLTNFHTFPLFVIFFLVSLALSQWNEALQPELNAI